jgi:AcrR family transcriptional regulator
MIKGEIRKRQILETAESMFAERGYEATSVQDILDVLHLSKGSFYHHFESKEIVLQKICENRALLAAMKICGESSPDGLEEMKKLLKAMIPSHGGGTRFFEDDSSRVHSRRREKHPCRLSGCAENELERADSECFGRNDSAESGFYALSRKNS